jgi:hypothetical protein
MLDLFEAFQTVNGENNLQHTNVMMCLGETLP